MSFSLKTDGFFKDILVVFTGTSLANLLNLLYQLLIAHRLSAVDFASFNSLLAVFGIVSAPLNTLQLEVTRRTAGFKARALTRELARWLTTLLRRHAWYAVITAIVAWVFCLKALPLFQIEQRGAGVMLALLLASMWIGPILSGAVQGVERFRWFSAVSVCSGIIKLLLAVVLTGAGFKIAGALGAFVAAQAALILGLVVSLRPYLGREPAGRDSYKELLIACVPFALASVCFIILASIDMVAVKFFFSPSEAGYYSVAQMIGKIFLFLPGAVTMVMFPRTSSLSAEKRDPLPVVRRSLGYVFVVCVLAAIVYNSMPGLILKALTGKVFAESVALGRIFGVSMSLLTLGYVIISYFLSVRDWRFLKWLIGVTAVCVAALYAYHPSLMHVQLVMCAAGAVLVSVLLVLLLGGGSPE